MFTNKRGNYSLLMLIETLDKQRAHWFVFSLGGITRPGSLGIISARSSTPLRRGKVITNFEL